MVLEMLDAADIVTKTAYAEQLKIHHFNTNHSRLREFARVFGVDFFSVLSRGSQFKVCPILRSGDQLIIRREGRVIHVPHRQT